MFWTPPPPVPDSEFDQVQILKSRALHALRLKYQVQAIFMLRTVVIAKFPYKATERLWRHAVVQGLRGTETSEVLTRWKKICLISFIFVFHFRSKVT